MTAIVLAGGRATRMKEPCDKAFLKIAGEPIIERQLKVLKKLFKEIIIVANSQDRYKQLENVSNNKWSLSLINDVLPERGPLGGIYSGLLASRDRYNFVVACDMPFINEALIKYMIETINDYDIVIPRIDEKFHPLFGIYSKECIPTIEKMLKKNRLRIANIFPKVKTHFVLKKDIKKFDERLMSLLNINTREDLAIAQKRQEEGAK